MDVLINEVEDNIITEDYLLIFPVRLNNRIDLTKHGIEIFNVDSDRFRELNPEGAIEKTIPAYQNIIYSDHTEYCYVIGCKEAAKMYLLLDFLRIIKPSNLVSPLSRFQIRFLKEGDSKRYWQMGSSAIWEEIDVNESVKQPLNISIIDPDKFHYLFECYLSRVGDDNFEKLTGIYFTAIHTKIPPVRFLVFMILLECLVADSDNTGIVYKICRVCAILLGDDPKTSEMVFENLKILYGDRSSLVHSGGTDHLNTDKVNYLHNLVCEVLNTFMLGKIELKKLIVFSNKYGFGQRANLLADFDIKTDSRFVSTRRKLLDVMVKRPVREKE